MENLMITLPLLILFLPLVSFIILIFFGKKLPRQGDWVAVGSIVITFFLAVYLFIQMILEYDPGFSHGASFSWIDLDAFKIDLGILVDNLTIIMLLIVTLVSSCTHIFSLEYMKYELFLIFSQQKIIQLKILFYNIIQIVHTGFTHHLEK